MRTSEFTPDIQNINIRSKIQPFGVESALYNKNRAENNKDIVQFVLYTTEHEHKEISKEKFVPTFNSYTNMAGALDMFSVKVSNIPTTLSKEELTNILTNKCPKLHSLYIHLVMDRNAVAEGRKPVSRGFAYIGTNNEEQAREIVGVCKDIVIGGLRLHFEVVKR